MPLGLDICHNKTLNLNLFCLISWTEEIGHILLVDPSDKINWLILSCNYKIFNKQIEANLSHVSFILSSLPNKYSINGPKNMYPERGKHEWKILHPKELNTGVDFRTVISSARIHIFHQITSSWQQALFSFKKTPWYLHRYDHDRTV